MEINLRAETKSRLAELAARSGRATDDLVEDALAAYLAEVAALRVLVDSRYDEIKSGQVNPVDGEEFFERLRRREDELLIQRAK
ncbi:MAG TPA: hypothetical protein VI756_12645 [Blastocatellia bacterium]